MPTPFPRSIPSIRHLSQKPVIQCLERPGRAQTTVAVWGGRGRTVGASFVGKVSWLSLLWWFLMAKLLVNVEARRKGLVLIKSRIVLVFPDTLYQSALLVVYTIGFEWICFPIPIISVTFFHVRSPFTKTRKHLLPLLPALSASPHLTPQKWIK